MSVSIVLGLQWGDEGKGKIVDFYSSDSDVIVRATGGNNAGHTVVIGDTTYKLHLIPSGLFQNGKLGVIGNGVVLDPAVFVKELSDLEDRANDSTIVVSGKTHVIMPWHRHFDSHGEVSRGSGKIGTTGRGIGPAYESKANRTTAIRCYDMLTKERFSKKVHEVHKSLEHRFKETGFTMTAEQVCAELEPFRERIAPLVTDTANLLATMLDGERRVLIEGAQGALLDFDHGSFPFVTSSNPTIGGAFTGTGVSPRFLKHVVGVSKAYVTRVGSGPFPTKLTGTVVGDYIQKKGAEVGTTTGRKRDCGWLDIVALNYAIKISGVKEIALTKLDVLGGLAELKIATAYKINGKITTDFPEDTEQLVHAEPIYTTMPGWKEEKLPANWNDLPKQARDYVEKIQELTKTPIKLVSVGAERSQTIVR